MQRDARPPATTTARARRSATRARSSAAGAALVNGTAAHGEDFDDTFEGGPVHAGAVVVPAVLAACERHNPDGAAALRGIAVGVEVLCRLSLVVPKAVHKAGFHPTAVFGAMGAAAGVAAALQARPEADRRCARHRRQHGERHHRVSRRRRLDQAHACRLGGAIRPARRPDGARGLFRPAHRVRGHARAVPRLRAHDGRQLRRAARRFRHALGDRDARLQALSVRDDDASLHRLRAAARRARHQAGGHRGHRLRCRRGHGASAVGAARRQAEARERLCGKVLAALLHRDRAGARQCGPWRFHR